MIDRATVDRILDAVRIEEVIGDFVSLRKRGTNYLGLCPFHQDKNPSMSVSTTKGIFKCFSCGKAGTAVSFIMEHEHLTYPEALRYLAKKYHIEIVEKEESAEEIAGRMKYESLIVVSEYAQKFYQNMLWNTGIGRAVGLAYFRERKFSDETIRKFGLGYSAGRDMSLNVEAIRKGYKKENLIESGLCIERENGSLADRFFDRVMFPIYSLSGRVIAFGGRTLQSDKTVAKYVNSPETEIYLKRNTLYGLYQAKGAIVKADKCILVEGYADVISMHQSGIENVVASSGTSLTVEQVRLIKRFTTNITIIYDGDEAGIKASLRGIDLVLEEGLNVKVVLLPPEDDPDSFAKAHSRTEILEYIEEYEKDFISYKSDILSKKTQSDPVGRAQIISDIIQSVAVIPDPILRNVYVDMISDRFGLKGESVLSKIKVFRTKRINDKRAREAYETRQSERTEEEEPLPAEKEPVQNGVLAVSERELVYYLIKFGEYILHFEEDSYIGAEPSEPETVSRYIKSCLDDDDIVFENNLYRQMFDEYYNFAATLPVEDPEAKQGRIIRHFSTLDNRMMVNETMNIICDNHPITVAEYRKAVVAEDLLLGRTVPKSVMLYKFRITEQQCAVTEKRISELQREGNTEAVRDMVIRLQMLNKVKNAFARELNRIN